MAIDAGADDEAAAVHAIRPEADRPAFVRSLLDSVVAAGRDQLGAEQVVIAAVHDGRLLVQACCSQGGARVPPGAAVDPDALPNGVVYPVDVTQSDDESLRVRLAGEALWDGTKDRGVDTVALRRESPEEQGLLLIIEAAALRDGPLHQAAHKLLDAVEDALAIQLGRQQHRLRAGLTEREEERRRWARELHDETLQQLGALQLLLTSARRAAHSRLAPDDPLVTAVDTATNMLAGQLTSLRHLITELRPAALDELGLRPPLFALAERTQALTGVKVTVEVSLRYADGVVTTRLLPDIELAIYRVVQEALTNIGRHSGATQAWVVVVEHDEWISVEIVDNGAGVREEWETGFGLAGMRERAALAGGTLEMVPANHREGSHGGTLIRLIVPAHHRQSAGET